MTWNTAAINKLLTGQISIPRRVLGKRRGAAGRDLTCESGLALHLYITVIIGSVFEVSVLGLLMINEQLRMADRSC